MTTEPKYLDAFKPTRTEASTDGGWIVTVTPPAFMKADGIKIFLRADQFERYKQWRDTGILIQDALPDLTPSQREGLMSGLSDEDFEQFEDEEDEDDLGRE